MLSESREVSVKLYKIGQNLIISLSILFRNNKHALRMILSALALKRFCRIKRLEQLWRFVKEEMLGLYTQIAQTI